MSRKEVCYGSGRGVFRPGPRQVTCPWCGRRIATTLGGRLYRHDVLPVLRGVAYDARREEWVAAVQYRSLMQLHAGRTAGEAEVKARSAIAAQAREEGAA